MSIPDVCAITSRRNEVVVDGVASQGTSHIETLVQRTSGKKGGGGGGWRGNLVPAPAPVRRGGGGLSLGRTINPTFQRGGATPLKLPDVSQPVKSSPSQGGQAEMEKSSLHESPAVVRVRPTLNLSSVKKNLACQQQLENKVSYDVWSKRVLRLMDGKVSGVSRGQVEKLYEEHYGEVLLEDWVNILRKAGLVRLDTGQTSLFLTARGKTGQNGLGQLLNGLAKTRTIPFIDKPRDWDVEITAVESCSEVWVSPTTSRAIKEQLEAELCRSHCTASGGWQGGAAMPPGNYFSAELQPGLVRRVKVNKLDRVNFTAHCVLIDYGKELVVPLKCLAPLQKEFWSTEAQAIKVQLFGFSSDFNVNVLSHVKEKLEGKRVVGREVEASSSQAIPLISIVEADPREDFCIKNLIEEMRLINLGEVALVNGGKKLAGVEVLNNNNNNNNILTVDQAASGRLEPQELPDSESFQCSVSHVAGPGELYIQPRHSQHAYTALHQQLQHFYSSGNGIALKMPKPGNY